MKKLSLFATGLIAAFIVAAPVSLDWAPSKGMVLSTDTAQARVGRPLTPGSVAGVNRRVHRRAYRRGVYYGAAGAAGAYGAYYYGRRAYCGYYPYPPCY
jgi:hypothetical protein